MIRIREARDYSLGARSRAWTVGAVLCAMVSCIAPSAVAQPEWAGSFCRERACVFVEADESLAKEAAELVSTLRLRLCGRGLAAFEAPFADSPPPGDSAHSCLRPAGKFPMAHWWTVYLRGTVTDRVLAVIDHLGRRSDEDVVRDLPRGPDAGATAWTVVLAVEEAVSPYLESVPDSAALGSGLALVEPPEVGGMPHAPQVALEKYPRLADLRVGVSLYYLDALRGVLAGPRFAVGTALSRHVSLSIGAGWAGMSDLRQGDIDGSVSHVPLDLLFSFEVLVERFFHLDIEVGCSAGFAVYQTSLGAQRRTDILFNPWALAGIRLGFELFGPLRLDFVPGAALPLLHDVLQNDGERIYRQDWVLASLALDLAVTF